MKTKLIPGIFIPYFSADFMHDAENEIKHLLGKTKNILQSYFLQKGDLYYACEQGSEDNKMVFGLFYQPHQPNQMSYKSALDDICRLTGNISLSNAIYTVPLNNVVSAGTGLVTKSLLVEGNISVEQIAEILKAFRSHCGLMISLIQVWTDNGCEIHGTSPLSLEGDPSLAWQNYMGKAVRSVLPHMPATFYQTWSTNAELTKELTGKGRDVSPEREAEYARYSKAK